MARALGRLLLLRLALGLLALQPGGAGATTFTPLFTDQVLSPSTRNPEQLIPSLNTSQVQIIYATGNNAADLFASNNGEPAFKIFGSSKVKSVRVSRDENLNTLVAVDSRTFVELLVCHGFCTEADYIATGMTLTGDFRDSQLRVKLLPSQIGLVYRVLSSLQIEAVLVNCSVPPCTVIDSGIVADSAKTCLGNVIYDPHHKAFHWLFSRTGNHRDLHLATCPEADLSACSNVEVPHGFAGGVANPWLYVDDTSETSTLEILMLRDGILNHLHCLRSTSPCDSVLVTPLAGEQFGALHFLEHQEARDATLVALQEDNTCFVMAYRGALQQVVTSEIPGHCTDIYLLASNRIAVIQGDGSTFSALRAESECTNTSCPAPGSVCNEVFGTFSCACGPGTSSSGLGSACLDDNECITASHDCMHNCVNTLGSFECTCRPGYELDSDGKRCNDIDECARATDGCAHQCFNSEGSFLCLCDAGYRVDPADRLRCLDVDECAAGSPCEQGCSNTNGSFSCNCGPGFRLNGDGVACDSTRCAPETVPATPEWEIRCATEGDFLANPNCEVPCPNGTTGNPVQWTCQSDNTWRIVFPVCIETGYATNPFATANAQYFGPALRSTATRILRQTVEGNFEEPRDDFLIDAGTGEIRARFQEPGEIRVTLQLIRLLQSTTISFNVTVASAFSSLGTLQFLSSGQAFAGKTPAFGGGRAPYSFSLSSGGGQLPAGLEVDAATGRIFGIPTQTGQFSDITVLAVDSNGAQILLEPVDFQVEESLTVLNGPDPVQATISEQEFFEATMPVLNISGGSGTILFNSIGTMPAGLRLNQETGDVIGLPFRAKRTPYVFSIVLTDDTGIFTHVRKLNITVSPVQDCSVDSLGPNGFGCILGECVDEVPFDGEYTCRCFDDADGDNCDLLASDAQSAGGASNSVMAAALGSMFAIIVVIIITLLVLRRKRLRALNKPFDFEAEMEAMLANGLPVLSNDGKAVPREIARRRIKLLDRLGAGQFGDVFKGTVDEIELTGVPEYLAAIKTLKEDPSARDRRELMQEAALMAQFQHANVVNLIGVCTRGLPFLIVVQYCEHGALSDYLRGLQAADKADRELPFPRMLSMSRQVAEGMAYLSGKGLIHRDLAARNVLLDSHYTCKVADFGLSRDIDDSDKEYYRANNKGLLPVRWSAPEALEEQLFSEKSDVWSWGVTVFEILTFGAMPYGDMTNQMVWVRVKGGFRLPCPDTCPEWFFSFVIEPCWNEAPGARPSFLDLLGKFPPAAEAISSDLAADGSPRCEEGAAAPASGPHNLYTEFFNYARMAGITVPPLNVPLVNQQAVESDTDGVDLRGLEVPPSASLLGDSRQPDSSLGDEGGLQPGHDEPMAVYPSAGAGSAEPELQPSGFSTAPSAFPGTPYADQITTGSPSRGSRSNPASGRTSPCVPAMATIAPVALCHQAGGPEGAVGGVGDGRSPRQDSQEDVDVDDGTSGSESGSESDNSDSYFTPMAMPFSAAHVPTLRPRRGTPTRMLARERLQPRKRTMRREPSEFVMDVSGTLQGRSTVRQSRRCTADSLCALSQDEGIRLHKDVPLDSG